MSLARSYPMFFDETRLRTLDGLSKRYKSAFDIEIFDINPPEFSVPATALMGAVQLHTIGRGGIEAHDAWSGSTNRPIRQ